MIFNPPISKPRFEFSRWLDPSRRFNNDLGVFFTWDGWAMVVCQFDGAPVIMAAHDTYGELSMSRVSLEEEEAVARLTPDEKDEIVAICRALHMTRS